METQNGKGKDFEQLFNNFSRFIIFLIQKFNLYQYGLDPDDILQDIKIKIWKLTHSEKQIINYTSYIKKIVNTSVIDQLRKIRREEALYLHEKQARISEIELSYNKETLRKKAIEETVGKAVDMLIDSRRQVVKLHLLNLSIPEISGYLNWSQDKTRNLLYRGLADLKKLLREMQADNELR
jgi:RNA polymerase sigma-70 factor (ECF subfamily)